MADLRRLADLVRELEEDHAKKEAAALDRSRDPLAIDTADVDPAPAPVRISMTIREADGQSTDELQVMMPQLDSRSASGLVLGGEAGGAIELELPREGPSPMIALSVKTGDIKRTKAYFAQLSEEVDRGVPKWAEHSLWHRAFTVALSIAALVGTVVVASGRLRGLNAGAVTTIGMGIVILSLFISTEILEDNDTAVTRRLYPAFELVSENRIASARIRTGFMLAGPVAFIVSLLASGVYASLTS